jgi:hypothetical protein
MLPVELAEVGNVKNEALLLDGILLNGSAR